MDEVLRAIGWPPTRPAKAALVTVFLSLTSVYVALLHLVIALLSVPAVVVHVGAWGLWFGWQGYLFPLRHEKHVAEYGADAYRRAFWTDILPGASFALFLVVSPAYYGVRTDLWAADPLAILVGGPMAVLGVVAFLLGVGLVSAAVATIGLAAAGFRYEYPGGGEFSMCSDCIYRYMEHPIFVGGIVASCGIALVVNTGSTLRLALVNVAAVPVYRFAEARRLTLVLDDELEEGNTTRERENSG